MARDVSMMLKALLNDERLSDKQREDFAGMQHRAKAGYKFNNKQFSYIEDCYLHLELDADEPAANLVSSGAVKATTSGQKFAFELMPRPLKPPGR